MDARLAKASRPVTRPANRQTPSPGEDVTTGPEPVSGRRSALQDGRAKILLVDDRPANLLAYEVILEELGEELIMALSGEEVLQQLRIHEFAVVLLDVSMPGMDGFETAKAIRETETRAHTPIIFLTAFSDDLKSAEAYAHGAVDYIQTPVIPAVLRAKVKVFADFVRMTEELNRRRHQEVVKEGVDRLRLILDSSLDAVVTIDERGEITGWNPHAETVFGWSREEALGAMLADLIIPEPYRFAFVHGLEHYRATGEGPLLRRRLELTAISKRGRHLPRRIVRFPFTLGRTLRVLRVRSRHQPAQSGRRASAALCDGART